MSRVVQVVVSEELDKALREHAYKARLSVSRLCTGLLMKGLQTDPSVAELAELVPKNKPGPKHDPNKLTQNESRVRTLLAKSFPKSWQADEIARECGMTWRVVRRNLHDLAERDLVCKVPEDFEPERTPLHSPGAFWVCNFTEPERLAYLAENRRKARIEAGLPPEDP